MRLFDGILLSTIFIFTITDSIIINIITLRYYIRIPILDVHVFIVDRQHLYVFLIKPIPSDDRFLHKTHNTPHETC